MEIIIDGYNVMWASGILNPVARFNFDLARQLLIKILKEYENKTKDKLILVLDGYKGTYPYTRHTQEDDLEIVITGKGINADHWIMETIKDGNFKGAIVTSDREIINFAKSRDVAVITAGVFEKKIMEEIKENKELYKELTDLRGEYLSRHSRKRRKN
jgi:predicted RNA-binding protein with PIN domain